MNSGTNILPKRNLKFGIVGPFQAGKSLLINCLLSRPIATVGDGTATTHAIVTYLYSSSEEFIEYYALNQWQKLSVDEFNRIDTVINLSEVKVYLKHDLLKHYTIIDIPGLGNDYVDNTKAEDAIKKLDYAILLINNEKVMTEKSDDFESFLLLKKYHIPYYFILNCTASKNWYANAESNISIYNKTNNLFYSFKSIVYPFRENEPIIVNLIWYWSYLKGSDSVTSKYDYLLNKYLYKHNLEPVEIKLHSNFHLIEDIFSMDNRMYLELKREFKEELVKLKEELCPVGTIQAFAFNSIPKGWMFCDGSKLDPTIHHELFNAIGTTFGGDGRTYFKIPDLRGRFLRGWCKNGNLDKSRSFGSYQNNAIPNHSHYASFERNVTDEDGGHKHTIKYQNTSYGHGGWTSSTYNMNEITNSDFMNSYVHGCDATLESGKHRHILPNICIDNVKDSACGTVNIANETRPDNCALLFCIKYSKGS